MPFDNFLVEKLNPLRKCFIFISYLNSYRWCLF